MCELYPDTAFSEQRIADQALSLLRIKVFTDLELEGFHRGSETEQNCGVEDAMAVSAQDQALRTRALRHVYSNSSTTQCRLCNFQAKTVEHLISDCSRLSGTQYKLRHDNVAKYIHW